MIVAAFTMHYALSTIHCSFSPAFAVFTDAVSSFIISVRSLINESFCLSSIYFDASRSSIQYSVSDASCLPADAVKIVFKTVLFPPTVCNRFVYFIPGIVDFVAFRAYAIRFAVHRRIAFVIGYETAIDNFIIII